MTFCSHAVLSINTVTTHFVTNFQKIFIYLYFGVFIILLVATKPLIYGGSVIDDFYLTFKDGRITDYYAVKEQEVLQKLIETDEGSYYLGEIALVSNKSPLSQTDTLFYNTLFDENTACHIGIGNASPSNIQNSSNLSEEELKAMGLNTSLLLVNVTLGTEDMKVVGIQEGGTEVLLMKDGDSQF